jgi:hypothetical protein
MANEGDSYVDINPNLLDISSATHDMITWLHRVYLLSSNRALQLYHTQSLHSQGHPVAAAVLRTTIKDTQCILLQRNSLINAPVKLVESFYYS